MSVRDAFAFQPTRIFSFFFLEKDSVGGASHEISKYHTKISRNRMSVAMGLGPYGVRGVWPWGQGRMTLRI